MEMKCCQAINKLSEQCGDAAGRAVIRWYLNASNVKQPSRFPTVAATEVAPHCQFHDSQQWIERQTAKRCPVLYFMVTFTVPAELRKLFWDHQTAMVDLLMKAAWQTLDSFARRDPQLKGKI